MFTEIKEAINFLARYYLGKVPRRRVGLFLEELGNHLAKKYGEMWDPKNPKIGENERMLRVRVNGIVDQLILTVAQTMMMDIDVLVNNTPDNVMLFVNPGQVYYKCGDRSPVCPIWVGDVTADSDYRSLPAHAISPQQPKSPNGSMMGAAGKVALVGKSNGMIAAPEIEDPWIAMHLEEVHPSLLDSPFGSAFKGLQRLAYYPKDHKPYTVSQFSQTRFGSNRVRPDHEALRKIQEQAAVKVVVQDGSGDSLPATPTSSRSTAGSAMEMLRKLSHNERDAVLRYLSAMQMQAHTQASHTSTPGSTSSGESKLSSDSPSSDENSGAYWNHVW